MKFQELERLFVKDTENFNQLLDRHRIYGFSMALINDYEISELVSFGLNENHQRMFQAASMSKTVFSFTVMKLHELGHIDINQNLMSAISKYLPSLKFKHAHKITYKELLNHTSGLNIHGFLGYLKSQKIPSIIQILDGERPANSFKLEFINTPKTVFYYSGGGYMLAQFLIEMQTSQSYQHWAEELVFKPLKMTNSILPISRKEIKKRDIVPAWSSHDTPIESGYVFYPELAAASLWSTPEDLSKFGIELMKAIDGRSAILSEASAKQMITLPENISTGYALGLRIFQKENYFLIAHAGDNIGYHGGMFFNPSKGSGAVVMINSDIGDEIPRQMIEALIESGL